MTETVAHPAYVYDLLAGPRTFAEVDQLQLDLSAARSQGAVPDTIILCEHPPTLTLGRASDAAAELVGGEEPYRALGWDVLRADRGGRSTWHGPGQLVCYPILDLRDHGKDLRRYAHDLERVVIEALAELGISAVAGEDREHVGVWIEGRKIASLGIRVDGWVARHGFALNVDCDLDAFARFRACGLDATPFTSVARELGRDVGIADARGPVLDALARVFSLELTAIPA
ncbi:MAG: lipoyl(octanoyl) transferase [Gaiellales bacterium]|jgi:lipoate-protein ligase B|nr:lipoyl(octanoyl) transferase [Gaiellales bacterium]